MSEFVKKVRSLTDVEELRDIQNAAQRRLEALNASSMGEGDKVQLLPEHQGRKPYDAEGVIKKVNPKKFEIDFNGSIWTVPHGVVMPSKK
jgi:hypothetical protein